MYLIRITENSEYFFLNAGWNDPKAKPIMDWAQNQLGCRVDAVTVTVPEGPLLTYLILKWGIRI